MSFLIGSGPGESETTGSVSDSEVETVKVHGSGVPPYSKKA